MACTINENLSKDLIVLWLSEALQGFSEGGRERVEKTANRQGEGKKISEMGGIGMER